MGLHYQWLVFYMLIGLDWFMVLIYLLIVFDRRLNELMETKGGKKKSSSSSSSSSSKSLFYEAPLGYSIEDVRPHGGIKKFRSAAYSNCVRKPS
ncbi:hypothetical protein Patl1_21553 [Pistacia atlantica]|uniref:Uncharacterized protein n=1 Tax=Pistacia atlantica TaxID=434234 RepID=A0ACC1BL74_9ROSI|nr:hypothetical protein Patl1_21553 [Pistacia atlantica]